METMERYVRAVQKQETPGILWFLEYPPLFTQGRSTKDHLITSPFPIIKTARGGKTTYHGPGQRVAYFIHALSNRDLKKYVYFLEEWIIEALAALSVKGERRPEGVGVWVSTHHGYAKIAAIGVRVQGWVTSHGISVNLNPDLRHYRFIDPCGLKNTPVTSIQSLGHDVPMQQLDEALLSCFDRIYEKVMIL